MKFPRFNLANRVTLLRLVIALVSFGVLLVLQEGWVAIENRRFIAWIGIVFFVAATASDALDGYLARRDNSVTAFGRIADPFVDKAIVCGSLIFLQSIEESAVFLRPWMVSVIIVREFLVNGIRGYMESVGISFAAEMPGKIKMVIQSVSIGFLMGLIAIKPNPSWLIAGNHLLIWGTMFLTVYSGTLYVVKAAGHLGQRDI